jgi:hypothetical protein
MHPVPLACDVEACFILVQHLRMSERGFDLLLHRRQGVGTPLHQGLECAHTHRRSQQILDHFTRSFIRQQLLLDQIDAHRPKGGSILHRRSHVLRTGSSADLLTGWAPLLFGLVFDDDDPLRRQIHDLSAFHLQAFYRAQVPLALLAALDRMHNHLIGRMREHQRASWMTGLPPWLLLAFLPQTLGLTMKAIRRGRQVTSVAIFLQALLQGLHLLLEQVNLLLQSRNQELLLVDHRLLQTRSFPQRLIFLS